MLRFSLCATAALGVLALLAAAPAGAETYYVTPAPTVAYYPAVSYYTPTVAYYPAPAVTYYAAPAVTYYTPAVSYYAPAVSYYAPAAGVTTYYRVRPRRVVATSYYYPT